jgi:hypothetical protein
MKIQRLIALSIGSLIAVLAMKAIASLAENKPVKTGGRLSHSSQAGAQGKQCLEMI